MKKIVKRIAAMCAAVMMMSSMAIGASAYEALNTAEQLVVLAQMLIFHVL